MSREHFDVLIIGAGLSGIGAAYHLQKDCPRKTYAILEAREALGGTWDLFRYPGIRSDSDMFTLGYAFRPWKEAKAIADGPSILQYIRETAEEHGITTRIRLRHRVVRAAWSTKEALWTVDVEQGPAWQPVQFTCRFLYLCAGYYNYESGYTPDFPGVEQFRGRIVHPQKWTPDIEYAGKRVVVIGSGATAVTLVPEMARTAAHVTMLQRSPTYVVSMPSRDKIANAMRRLLPSRLAYSLARWKNVLFSMMFYALCKKWPQAARRLIDKGIKAELGDHYQLQHFTPRYNPWEQRLCLVPDADLFRAIREERVSVVTDQIDTFTENGVRLGSGKVLEADLIVTATGLQLKLMGGLQLTVDGKQINPSQCLVYKGMMLSEVPNLAFAVGYTNASWTLKADLTSQYVCRLINYLDTRGYTYCQPRVRGTMREEPIIDFNSSYVLRDIDKLPRQGTRKPWKLYQNYALDLITLRFRSVTDSMVFGRSKG